jgi:hypothetical protein
MECMYLRTGCPTSSNLLYKYFWAMIPIILLNVPSSTVPHTYKRKVKVREVAEQN